MSIEVSGTTTRWGGGNRRAGRKEVKETLDLAADLGWTVLEVKNGWRLLAPDGVTTTNVHRSSSDPYAMRSVCRTLRRHGLDGRKN